MARVALILVNHNGSRLLPALFAAIGGQSRPADQVVLVDNASTDDSVALVQREYPTVLVLALAANHGFAEGNNRGAAAAEDADYLALLNTDARPAPRWLEELAAALDADPAVAAVVPKVYLGSAPVIESAGAEFDSLGFAWGRGIHERDEGQFDEAVEVGALTGCAMMVRRVALGGEAPFEPGLFMYYEDLELALRLRGAGHRLLYVPRAVVTHQRATSVRSSWDRPRATQLHYATRNRLWILAKHYPVAVLLRGLPWIALSVAYFDTLILRDAGLRSLLAALSAQWRYLRAGCKERRLLNPAAAALWRPWMKRHGLADILRLKARVGSYLPALPRRPPVA